MITLPNYSKEELDNMQMCTIFQEGEYCFKTESFENKISQNGNPMTEIVFKFSAVNYEFEIHQYFMHEQITNSEHVMHARTMHDISSYLSSVGKEYSPTAFTAGNLTGTTGKAYVFLKKEKTKSGEDVMRRRIKYFISKNDKSNESKTFDDDIPWG